MVTPLPKLHHRKAAAPRNTIKCVVIATLLSAFCTLLVQVFLFLPKEKHNAPKSTSTTLRKATDNAISSTTIELTNDKCESPLRDHFNQIYAKADWGLKVRSAPEYYGDAQWPIPGLRMRSASGGGSYLGPSTENSLRILKRVIEEYNVKSMIDVPW
jgi:hypothetical protein